jgi:formate-dependent nitrite reductase membrane component NrfD
MKNSHSDGAGLALFLAIIATSAVTMLWLFWRFPVATAITTVIVLAGLAVATTLARSIDFEGEDLDRRDHQVGSH